MAVVYDPNPAPPPRSGVVSFVEQHIVISGILLIGLGILVAYLFSKLKNASGTSTAANANQQPQTLFVPTSNTFETINDITGASGAAGGVPVSSGLPGPMPGGVSAGSPVSSGPVSPDGGVSPGSPAAGGTSAGTSAGGSTFPPGTLPPEAGLVQPFPGGTSAGGTSAGGTSAGGSTFPPGTLPPEAGLVQPFPSQGGTSAGSPGSVFPPNGTLPPQPIGEGGPVAILRSRRAKDPRLGLPIRSMPSPTAPIVSYGQPGSTVGLGHPNPVEGWFVVDHLGSAGYLDALDVVGLA